LAQQAVGSALVVPAGTVVPLTLVNPIKSKSTRPGDSIRAVVAFPVTIDGKVAIPAGTYVDGTLAAPLQKAKHQATPDVQLHLTQLVYSNGYTAAIQAMQARLVPPSTEPAAAVAEEAENRTQTPYGNSFVSGQTVAAPTPAPLPSVGPSPGLVIGISLGATAAVIGTAVALSHHGARNTDYIVHDAGWQFEMKLESPLSLDPIQVALATGSIHN
jgi:type IV secretion system protein VirB10